MATTISFPTAVTTNGANFANTFADDGTNTTHPSGGWGSEGDITLSSFNSLAIPVGATVDGIEIIAEVAGNTGATNPHMFVYNSADWSSAVASNSVFGKSYATVDPAWGSSSNLWGLTWNYTTAKAIQVKMDSSSVTSGRRVFFDYIKVRITYTAATGPVMAKVNGTTDENISRVVGFPNTGMAKINGITDTD